VEPLYGRDDVLERARALLERAFAGQGHVLLFTGEPGIGKSRLSEQVALEAAERGAAVACGRCWEARGAPAYWPWIQVLRELEMDRSPETPPTGRPSTCRSCAASPAARPTYTTTAERRCARSSTSTAASYCPFWRRSRCPSIPPELPGGRREALPPAEKDDLLAFLNTTVLRWALNAVEAARDAGVRLLILNSSARLPAQPSEVPAFELRREVETLLRELGPPPAVGTPLHYFTVAPADVARQLAPLFGESVAEGIALNYAWIAKQPDLGLFVGSADELVRGLHRPLLSVAEWAHSVPWAAAAFAQQKAR
jgi:hypothetical protein